MSFLSGPSALVYPWRALFVKLFRNGNHQLINGYHCKTYSVVFTVKFKKLNVKNIFKKFRFSSLLMQFKILLSPKYWRLKLWIIYFPNVTKPIRHNVLVFTLGIILVFVAENPQPKFCSFIRRQKARPSTLETQKML